MLSAKTLNSMYFCVVKLLGSLYMYAIADKILQPPYPHYTNVIHATTSIGIAYFDCRHSS